MALFFGSWLRRGYGIQPRVSNPGNVPASGRKEAKAGAFAYMEIDLPLNPAS